MKTILFGLLIMTLFLSGCGETDIEPLTIEGRIKGRVFTYNEFRVPKQDQENVLVKLDGSDPEITAFTDKEGRFELQKVPTGTYNLVFSKEGYGEIESQGIQVSGGDEPFYLNDVSLFQKSTILIENLEAEWDSSGNLICKAIISYNSENRQAGSSYPGIILFIHTDGNPSKDNYVFSYLVPFSGDSGSAFIFLWDKQYLPEETFQIIAYGVGGFSMAGFLDYFFYDIYTNRNKFPSIGVPSNVASITSKD